LLPDAQSAILLDMISKALLRVAVAICLTALALPVILFADDSAAAIAAGGLVPRRETRIVMAKEVLQISDKKVVVDYDFRNDTIEDVTTEVAFPVPPYNFSETSQAISIASFPDFQLSIDGKPVQFKTEARAMLKRKDVTEILVTDGIDVASFGHSNDDVPFGRDLVRLPEREKKRLATMGILDLENPNGYAAKWEAHLQYHWKQIFPAHSMVHIRHEYSPITGDAYEMGEDAAKGILKAGKIPVDETKPKPLDPNDRGDLTSFCLGLPLAKNMAASFPQQFSNAPKDETFIPTLWMQWVDFILTSANTWQRPIEDFTLIIERPKQEHGGRVLVSFCSPMNGKVEKLDAEHFQVHLTNFVPNAELHIGFFEVPLAKPGQAATKK
jgi:hypothetical protein